MADTTLRNVGDSPTLVGTVGESLVLHQPVGALTPQQVRRKVVDSRRRHADGFLLANHKDPTKPIYTVDELTHVYGWTGDAMCESYDDAMLTRCSGKCRRMLITLDPRDISIDIIDPDLPPVWGENTQFMCVKDNRIKSDKTRARRIADRILELAALRPPPPPGPVPYPADSLLGDWAWRPPDV